MSVQTSYGFKTPVGIAGGLFDLTPYSIDSRISEENTGALGYGLGVVQGAAPGSGVVKPISTSGVDVFEGITLNGFSSQHDLAGNVQILKGQAVGVLRYGKCWAKVTSTATPAYGDALHLVIDGDDAGCFTDASVESGAIIAVNGRFIGTSQGGLAPVELYYPSAAAPVSLGDLSDVDLSVDPTDGQALVYDSSTEKWSADDQPATPALSELTDVDLSVAPTDGQILTYDGTDKKWVADDVPAESEG